MSISTWRKLISKEMALHDESVNDVIAVTPKDLDQDREFDSGYGETEGIPFTLWTLRRVYFPVCYDGAEWVKSVSRNPCEEATVHVGG